MFRENFKRSAAKTISWRLVGTLSTMGVVLVAGGSLQIALFVGSFEAFLKLFFYYLHERAWDRIAFGRLESAGAVIWLTGLSGSGKTTLAREVAAKLRRAKLSVEVLDGDEVRRHFPLTGFTKEERDRHVQHMGYLASKLESRRTTVIACFVSPYRETRHFVRSLCQHFIEVYVSTPLEECESRDPKGLYQRARRGEIKDFTGIDAPYEPPTHPEIEIDTRTASVEECADRIVKRVLEPRVSPRVSK